MKPERAGHPAEARGASPQNETAPLAMAREGPLARSRTLRGASSLSHARKPPTKKKAEGVAKEEDLRVYHGPVWVMLVAHAVKSVHNPIVRMHGHASITVERS